MVEGISDFCVSLICTIMMVIVLELIIPEGKSKKYVNFVCGIVVTLVLIEPVTNLFNINVDEVFANVNSDYKEIKVDENLYEKSVKESYEQTLINDIIFRLEENGYNVSNVKVEYDDETFEPVKIYMNLESENSYVQPVKIEVSTSNNSKTVRQRINKE